VVRPRRKHWDKAFGKGKPNPVFPVYTSQAEPVVPKGGGRSFRRLLRQLQRLFK
jgi:hypothetical protein